MNNNLEDLRTPKTRKVWENTQGTVLMTVTGFLEEGEYEVGKSVQEDGTVVLECTPKSEE